MTKIGYIYPILYTKLSLILLIGAMLAGCVEKSPEEPQELKRAAQAVAYMIAPKQLARSSFYAIYPEGKPSQFVKWMFSTFGTAEWPPAEDSPDEAALEGAMALRIPIIPRDVAIIRDKPDPDAGKQLVVRPDDLKGAVIAEGYLKPEGPPALIRVWKLTRLKVTDRK